MTRLLKNPDYDDDSNRHHLETEAKEWRQKMEMIWTRNHSLTDIQKIADILELSSLNNYVDVPLITRVIQLQKEQEDEHIQHPYTFIPQTAEEKENNRLARCSTDTKIHAIRRSPIFGDLAVIGWVIRADPISGWERSTLLNVRPLKNKQYQLRLDFFMGKLEKDLDSRKETLDSIIRNSQRSEIERARIKEIRRKKKKKDDSSSGG